jgi:uncharacterized membrane protein YfcA
MVSVPAVLLALVACTLSAAAGLGGSLVLVPGLGLIFGVKEGIALAAFLLGANNLGKLIAYRRTLPVRKCLPLIALTILGSLLGASLLLRAPETVVHAAVVLVIGSVFVLERAGLPALDDRLGAGLALAAGVVSGFSGTSGPLKGVALRALRLDRQHMVGAASLVSFAGDVTKAVVFLTSLRLSETAPGTVTVALLVMPGAVVLGRAINRRVSERAYAGLFWLVMAGYVVRLAGR